MTIGKKAVGTPPGMPTLHVELTAEEKAARAAEELANDAVRADYLANQKHLDDRREVRPSVADQLEMQHHDSLTGETTWKDMMDRTAAMFPKPDA